MAPARWSRSTSTDRPEDEQIRRLQREKAQLEQELAKARFVVDVQGKLQRLV
jgi:transposase